MTSVVAEGTAPYKSEGSKRAKQGRNLTKRGRKGGEDDNGPNRFKTGVQKY
jgi:hypothetical protein